MLPGVVCSHDAGRVPPLSDACFSNCFTEAFQEDSCVVWLSDSAIVYQQLQIGTHGVVDKHFVIHSATPPEYIRSVEILANTDAGDIRAGTANSNLADSSWKHLESHIPPQLGFPQTMAAIDNWTQHVRFGQWMYMTGHCDRWPAFCEAVRNFELRTVEERLAAKTRGEKRPLADADKEGDVACGRDSAKPGNADLDGAGGP